MIKIKEILLNNEATLEGVDHVPQIGWKLISDKRNTIQETYQYQISDQVDFSTLVYDSGVVESKQSHHHLPSNFDIQPYTQYFVRVKVKANDGSTSDWSPSAHFFTGKMNTEWTADFISIDDEKDAKNSKTVYLRKDFELDKSVASAYLHASALGLYIPYLNGKRVGDSELAPGFTSYHHHICYQSYDVTDQLKQGINCFGAHLGAGWYKGMFSFNKQYNHYGDQSAFIAELYVEYTDGTTDVFVTDQTWKGHDAPVVFAEIYDGETYDANLEILGWCEAGFNDQEWIPVHQISYDKAVLTAQPAARNRVMKELETKRIFKTPEGDTVIDFGQNLTGWVQVKAKGEPGDKIIFTCFEELDKDGNVYLDNLRTAKQKIEYRFGDDKEITYHPSFTYQGFRYVYLEEFPGDPKPEQFTAQVVYSDMDRTSSLETSNRELNQLNSNILWGMRGNFLDIPTDCPQRDERMGWTGDAQIFCRTAMYLMNTYNFFAKWLRDVKEDQTEAGAVPHVVPDVLSGRSQDDKFMKEGTVGATAWADVAVILPWTMYLMYGDKVILKEQFNSMKAWVDFMVDHSENYRWSYQLQFGDWVALDAEEGSYKGATPDELVMSAYFAYSSRLMAMTCEVLGKKDEAKYYFELSENIKKTYQENYYNSDGSMNVQTQTAHILSLYFDLVPDEWRNKTVDGLLKLIEKYDGHLSTGFVGTPYLLHALSENGETQAAYDLLLRTDYPSWLYQVEKGATTIWEHWDGIKPDGSMWSPDMNSFNHYAYGAVADWMYRVMVGFEVDVGKPGFEEIHLQPHPTTQLDHVKGVYESIYGELKSSWSQKNSEITYQWEIPANTKAVIHISEDEQIINSDGIQFKKNGGENIGVIGSGSYVVVTKSRK